MKIGFEIVALLAAAVPALAQTGLDAKGIYLDPGDTRPAVKFNVLLDRDGTQKVVPATYSFRDGDRMKFRFELSRDSYIYVIHHSIEADPARAERYTGARGIEIIRDEDRASKKESYQLLFPNQASGQNNLVGAHSLKTVPGTDTGYFRMDEHPGLEKLVVIVSSKPLDMGAYFDPRTGKLRGAPDAAAPRGKNDTDDDVIGKLSRSLIDYSGNANVQSAKGIEIVDGYAAPKDGAKPMVVLVDLKHVPR
jgi:hypothetical protein